MILNEVKHEVIEKDIINYLFLHDNIIVPKKFVRQIYSLYFIPWDKIIFTPRKKRGDVLSKFIEKIWSNEWYREVNQKSAGNDVLSKFLTISFFQKLAKSLNTKNLKKTIPNQGQQVGQCQGGQCQQRGQGGDEDDINDIVTQLTKEDINHIMEGLNEESDSITTFSHLGFPVSYFYENPDKLREMMSNRIIVDLVKVSKAIDADVYKLKNVIANNYGIPLGVKISGLRDIPNAIPQEFIDDDIFVYKVASKSLYVKEKRAMPSEFVIYVDKSGSMSSKMSSAIKGISDVVKISFASSIAIALAKKFKVTLKFFDTDVHDEVKDKKQLIEQLLTVKADGGTNITNVLEDATKYVGKKVVVISDGIDEVDENVARKVAKEANVNFILLQTDNEVIRKYYKTVRLEKASFSPIMII